MQSVLHVQSILDTSLSTTAGHLPKTALELRRAETTISASQKETHFQVAPAEQLQEYHDIVRKSECQVADRGPCIVPDDNSRNSDVEDELIPTFKYNMIILRPAVIVVDVKHIFACKTRIDCLQNAV
jgi:hypothetical protein